ncbi:restriction endonuclease subunit S [Levilactobacillus brevis]|uniref:restriction endonuclease subunit S n=1 Tax=Levilactobacillus brevis TaxID=1580 RepID=UPI001BAD8555|nr:restriction endonuclease subunit S [Levilactobacillus brevis]MBS0979073.1 restriction endonuclease subunit S [Levilactobacillus brevis]
MTKTKPSIRFQGFEDNWEQRQVKDIFQITRGKVLATSEISESRSLSYPYPVYSSQTKNDGLMGYYSDYLFDVAITWTTDGANAGTVRYRAGKFYSTNVNGVLLSKDGYTNKAIAEILNKVAWKWVSHVGNPKLMNNVMSDIKIIIPSTIEEQVAISKMIEQLDKTITLHQRQLELLKEQKKGFLQKMFPKAGETAPEIRFSGFADDWKQYNLREVATRVRGNDGRMNLPTLTISAGSGWMDQRDRFSKNIAGKEQQNYTLLKKGELSYNHGNSKLAQYGVVFALESYAEVLVPRVYHSFSVSGQSDPKFIEQMFATHRPDRELRKLVSSGARMDGLLNINYDAFMDILIMLPSVAEQQLVASMFSKIDELITLHQHKLEALKEMKKGFLQQMFV